MRTWKKSQVQLIVKKIIKVVEKISISRIVFGSHVDAIRFYFFIPLFKRLILNVPIAIFFAGCFSKFHEIKTMIFLFWRMRILNSVWCEKIRSSRKNITMTFGKCVFERLRRLMQLDFFIANLDLFWISSL